VLSGTRRRSLLDWARRHESLIVEDDYDAEFRYDRKPVRALQGLDPDHVAYLGTTSKTLAPALPVEGIAADMHVLLRLPPDLDDRTVPARAEDTGVLVTPLSRFSLSASTGGGLVLGYGRIHEDAIDTAVTALTRAIHDDGRAG
jgi:DNA-binding transcriptional MocR family regulator